jgi:hypothetical protein
MFNWYTMATTSITDLNRVLDTDLKENPSTYASAFLTYLPLIISTALSLHRCPVTANISVDVTIILAIALSVTGAERENRLPGGTGHVLLLYMVLMYTRYSLSLSLSLLCMAMTVYLC